MNIIIGENRLEIVNIDNLGRAAVSLKAVSWDRVYGKPSSDNSTTNFYISLKLFKAEKLLKSILILDHGWSPIRRNSIVLLGNKIFISCSINLYCFSCSNIEIDWSTTIDDNMPIFGIYQYQNDCIIHGEMTISRIDINGNILWQHWGKDIFTTIDQFDDFKMTSEFIEVRDFENKVYRFDYEGTIILSPT